MSAITLRNKTSSGDLLEATFLPEKGMNLISFKRGDLEVIDQTTKTLFDERYAGLGALIGPHFHRRKESIIPKVKEEALFPHIARVRSKGVIEPFSHGIARYAPWQAQATETRVVSTLTGKDTWNGVPLAELEGQNFKMQFTAELSSVGLNLELSVVSDTDSVVGIHYYYHLPNQSGTVLSSIQNTYLENSQRKIIPSSWNYNSQQQLHYSLEQEADFTFYPFPNPLEGKILMDAGTYQLMTTYQSQSQENSWQLYHPKGSSYVCIEPVSAQDPRHPNLTVSSIHIQLQILKGT